MARVRRKCTQCGTKWLVYKGGTSDVQFFICKFCKESLATLAQHKPYVGDVKPKEEYL